jgi:hypothetical protein
MGALRKLELRRKEKSKPAPLESKGRATRLENCQEYYQGQGNRTLEFRFAEVVEQRYQGEHDSRYCCPPEKWLEPTFLPH